MTLSTPLAASVSAVSTVAEIGTVLQIHLPALCRDDHLLEVLRSFVNARLRAECARTSNECRRTEAGAKSDG